MSGVGAGDGKTNRISTAVPAPVADDTGLARPNRITPCTGLVERPENLKDFPAQVSGCGPHD
ncbi:hypothetical protein [Caudoviricetes sp.]|nr:hypothetical protein [Caudoviricetes sp.]UOF81112.1 hypothetical protein [Caudoviricetes sp.]UOF82252.1 hypothetical protein [Caudoviricetes sp.]UOF82457.1 hypothetical protein [Caudoviricetes sp.]UOF82611.1 hypothetical protein [Caudoviricetes sp.]